MRAWGAFLVAAAIAAPAHADPACRTVEVHFTPGAPGLQIAIWVEDSTGNFVDTVYLTRTTGQFGLGNRPGSATLKTDFGWPYGRREMVAPVWAHRRNHHYPRVVMGGICGNAPGKPCPSGGVCQGGPGCAAHLDCACDDTTIAYHQDVSTFEPFYCSPSGPSKIDAMSCASKGTFAKGAFADGSAYSLYPPRADLDPACKTPGDCVAGASCVGGHCVAALDSPDTAKFAALDDLVAVSQATPPAGAPVMPPVTWFPSTALADGDYVLWLEASQESDFNAAHDHPSVADTVTDWDFEGHRFLGQPSVVYAVPFHVDGTTTTAQATDFAGYGTWDGSDGVLHPPDGTIETGKPGSGAGRLLLVGGARLSVVVGGCGVTGPVDAGTADMAQAGPLDMADTCRAPAAVDGLAVAPTATALDLSWVQPATGTAPAFYEVRYHQGAAPITDDSFARELAPSSPPPPPMGPGSIGSTTLAGLMPSTVYTVAVRARAACGSTGPVSIATAMTHDPSYTTLSGCFVATAAYGSPGDRSVVKLRRFRDAHLVGNPAGALFIVAYYRFGPSLAHAIAPHPRLRALARWLLAPLVAALP